MSSPFGGLSKPASGPATNWERLITPPGRQSSRVLVVVDPGCDGQSVGEILRREHDGVMLESSNDTVVQRVKFEEIDVVVLCSNQPGGRMMELLNRITLGNPGLPVIVVTNPTPAATPNSTCGIQDVVSPPAIDAELLLRSVREALTEPRVKRLIRLTGSHGEPCFVARNARWLSEDLQARYSMPFHWNQPDAPMPVRIANASQAIP